MERRRALDIDVFISCTYTGIILGKGWASRSNLVSMAEPISRTRLAYGTPIRQV